MKRILLLFVVLLISCQNKKKEKLSSKVYDFNVSECKYNCGIDSLGLRKNKVIDNDLHIKLGYILNCSWKNGYFKNINETNDTLIVELDRPHSKQGEYPMVDCDCFFFFNFKIKDYNKTPKAIRVVDLFYKGKFLDERRIITEDVPETEIITED